MGRELKEPDLSRIQRRQGQLGGNHRVSGLGPCYSPPWHIPSLDTLSAATTIMHITNFHMWWWVWAIPSRFKVLAGSIRLTTLRSNCLIGNIWPLWLPWWKAGTSVPPTLRLLQNRGVLDADQPNQLSASYLPQVLIPLIIPRVTFPSDRVAVIEVQGERGQGRQGERMGSRGEREGERKRERGREGGKKEGEREGRWTVSFQTLLLTGYIKNI